MDRVYFYYKIRTTLALLFFLFFLFLFLSTTYPAHGSILCIFPYRSDSTVPFAMEFIKDAVYNDSLVRASHVEHLQDNIWEVELFVYSSFPKVSCHFSCVQHILPIIPADVLVPLLHVMNEESQALLLRVDYCTYGVIHGTELLTTLLGDILFLTDHPSYTSCISSGSKKRKKYWVSLQETFLRLRLGYPSRPTVFRWKLIYDLSRRLERTIFAEESVNRKLFHKKARCVVLDVIRGDTFVVQWEPCVSSSRIPAAYGPPPSSLSSSSPSTEGVEIIGSTAAYPPVLVLRMTPTEKHHEELVAMTIQETVTLQWARRYIGQTLEVEIHTVSLSDVDVACNIYAYRLDRRGAVEGLARGEDGEDISALLLRHRLATLKEIPFPFFPFFLDLFSHVAQLVVADGGALAGKHDIEFRRRDDQLGINEKEEEEVKEEGTNSHHPALLSSSFKVSFTTGEMIHPEVKSREGYGRRTFSHRNGVYTEERITEILTIIQQQTQLKRRTLMKLIDFLGKEWWWSRCNERNHAFTKLLMHQYTYGGDYKAIYHSKLLCFYSPLRFFFPMYKLAQLRAPFRGGIKQILLHFDRSIHSFPEEQEKGENLSSCLSASTTFSFYIQLDVEIIEQKLRWQQYTEKVALSSPSAFFRWSPDPNDEAVRKTLQVTVEYIGVHTLNATLFVSSKEYPLTSSFTWSDHRVEEGDYKKIVPNSSERFFSLLHTFRKYVSEPNKNQIVIFNAFVEYEVENDEGSCDEEVTKSTNGEEKEEGKKRRTVQRQSQQVFYYLSSKTVDEIEEMGEDVVFDALDEDLGFAKKDADGDIVDAMDLEDDANVGGVVGGGGRSLEKNPIQADGDNEKMLEDTLSKNRSMHFFLSTVSFFFRLELPASCKREAILKGELFQQYFRKWMSSRIVCLPLEMTRVHGILGFLGNIYFPSTAWESAFSYFVGDAASITAKNNGSEMITTLITTSSFQHLIRLLESSKEDIFDELRSCFGENSLGRCQDDESEMNQIWQKTAHVKEELVKKQTLLSLPQPPPVRVLRGQEGRGSGKILTQVFSVPSSYPSATPLTSKSAVPLSNTSSSDAEDLSVVVPSSHSNSLSVISSVVQREWIDAQSPHYTPPSMADAILPPTLPLSAFSLMVRGLLGEHVKHAKTVIVIPNTDRTFRPQDHMDFYFWTKVRFPSIPCIFEGHLDQLPLALCNLERRYCSHLLRLPLSPEEAETGMRKDEPDKSSSHRDPLEHPIEGKMYGKRGSNHIHALETTFSVLMSLFFHLRALMFRYEQEFDSSACLNEYDLLCGIPDILFDPAKLSPSCSSQLVIYRVPIPPTSSTPSSPFSWRLFLGGKSNPNSDAIEIPSPLNSASDLININTKWMRKAVSVLAFSSYISPPELSTVTVELPKVGEEKNLREDQVHLVAESDAEFLSTGENPNPMDMNGKKTTTTTSSSSPCSPLPCRVHLRRVAGYYTDDARQTTPDTESSSSLSPPPRKQEAEVLLATTAGSRQVSGINDLGYQRRLSSRPVLYHPLPWLHVLGRPLMRREELRERVDVQGTSQLWKEETRQSVPNVKKVEGSTPSSSTSSRTALEEKEKEGEGEKVKVTQYIALSYHVVGLALKKPYKPFSMSRFSKNYIHASMQLKWCRCGFIRDWCSLLLYRSSPYSPHSFSSEVEKRAAVTATGMLHVFGSVSSASSVFFCSKRQLRRTELIPDHPNGPPRTEDAEAEEEQEQQDLKDLANPVKSLLEDIDDAFLDTPCSRLYLSITSSLPAVLGPPQITVKVRPVNEGNNTMISRFGEVPVESIEEYNVYAPLQNKEEMEYRDALSVDFNRNRLEDSSEEEMGIGGGATTTRGSTRGRNDCPFASRNPYRPFESLDNATEDEKAWTVTYDFQKGFVCQRV